MKITESIHNQLIRGQSLWYVCPTYKHTDLVYNNFNMEYGKDAIYTFIRDQRAVMIPNPDGSSKRAPFCRFTSISAHSEQVYGSHAIIVFDFEVNLRSRPAIIWQAAQVTQERYRINS